MIFFSIFGNPLFSPSVTKGKKDKILAEVVKLIFLQGNLVPSLHQFHCQSLQQFTASYLVL
jgi:hypothetical protein